MGLNIARFYKREQWQLDCEIVTPMFLGNSEQEAELRAAPFKGLLRYWWRVANGGDFAANDHKHLLQKENELFGSAADDDSGGKSRVSVAVHGSPLCYSPNQFPRGQHIPHPEVRPHGNPINIDRFLYLGYGPITGSGQLAKEGKGAFRPKQNFRLLITAQSEELDKLRTTLQCFQQFGAIGSRSRNGWGCFDVQCKELSTVKDSDLFNDFGANWQQCFAHDYPHALGVDGQQFLLWKCHDKHPDWQGVMNELAEKYLTIRTAFKFSGGGAHSSPQDRHALGYPAGRNHEVRGWGNGRHGSALRLLVRKEENGYRGYFLHLPHLFSNDLWPNGKNRQIKIWQQVHQGLDKLCNRVSFDGVK